MHVYVVNLDRSPERLAEFRARNAHLPDIQRFSAVDGASIDRRDLVAAGRIVPELPYSNGAIGCALSHVFFWEAAASQGAAITVCEDDAVFHRRFAELAPRVIAGLPADWDLVMWGWNFDSILFFDLMPGVSPCLATFDQEKLRTGIDAFQSMPVAPQAFRLWRAFGTVCYTVSPGGARKLLERCLPLAPFTIPFPMINPAFPNNGIDIAMNRHYPDLNAWVSLPPLVITRNDHGISTVLA